MKTRISAIRQLAKQNNCSVRTIHRAIAKGEITWTDDNNAICPTALKINKAKAIRYDRLEYINIINCKTLLDMQHSRYLNYMRGGNVWQSEEMTGWLREHISYIDDDKHDTFDWFDVFMLSVLDSFYKNHEVNHKLINGQAKISLKQLYESVFIGSEFGEGKWKERVSSISKVFDKIDRYNDSNMQISLVRLDKAKNPIKRLVLSSKLLDYTMDDALVIRFNEPAIGQIARELKHLVSVPVGMLEYGRNSIKTQAIKTYIAYRIVLGNCQKNKLKQSIVFSTLAIDCGWVCEREYAKNYFEYLKEKGFVKTYEITNENISWTVQQENQK